MTKGSLTIRILAGAYLVYLGYSLVRDSVLNKPENFIVFLLIGLAFLILGATWCILGVKKYIKKEYTDYEESNIEEDDKVDSDQEVVKEEVEKIEEKEES